MQSRPVTYKSHTSFKDNVATLPYNNYLIIPDLEKKNKENQADLFKKEYIEPKLGLVAFIYDKAKNLTGLGKGSKKAIAKIEEFSAGKTTREDTEKYLKEYKYNQKDGTEVVIDSLTCLSAGGLYANAKKFDIISDALMLNKTLKIPKNIGLIPIIIAGAITKPILKSINMIGVDKETKKKERTRARDFLTGAIDGAFTPVLFIKNIVAGAVTALGINSISRYLFIKKDDKSPNDYANQQQLGLGIKAFAIALFALGTRKNTKSLKAWQEASLKAVENAKKMKPSEVPTKISDLQDLLFQLTGQMKIKLFTILGNPLTSNKSKMIQLEKYNLFIPKCLQMVPDNLLELAKENGFGKILNIPGAKNLSTIIKGLKSDCPASRTIAEAQKIISKTYKDKYVLQGNKVLGTGTMAETYLAKEKSTGKEVVIKLVKKGIIAEKIEKDRKQILDLLDKGKIKDIDQLSFYKRQVNCLFDAWVKEIDLNLEMEATNLLAKGAKQFNAVKPIEIKNNIYVMEKSPGVQFNKLIGYLKENNRKLSKKEIATLSINYLKVFLEQLLSVSKEGGKIMHADPHPGNIFIDLNNLEKPLTFIDTGNVLRYTPEEAITNVVNHLDYLIGNSKGIAKAMVKNATLPESISENKAIEIITKELNEKIYNKKNKLPLNLFQDINSFCLNVMHQNKIIPSPNNTNLLKAEMTYVLNLVSLADLKDYIALNEKLDKKDLDFLKKQSILAMQEITGSIANSFTNNRKYTLSELKSRIDHVSQNKELFLSILKSFNSQ